MRAYTLSLAVAVSLAACSSGSDPVAPQLRDAEWVSANNQLQLAAYSTVHPDTALTVHVVFKNPTMSPKKYMYGGCFIMIRLYQDAARTNLAWGPEDVSSLACTAQISYGSVKAYGREQKVLQMPLSMIENGEISGRYYVSAVVSFSDLDNPLAGQQLEVPAGVVDF